MISWPGPVVSRGEPGFRHRHAHAVAETLAERTSSDFHARRVAAFRVTGRLAAPLAEPLQLVERQIVTGQMQQAVQQHRTVPRREHEAVAIEPVRIFRIVLQELRPQRVSHGGGAHRHAGMAGVGILHGIGGQKADGVDTEVFQASWAVGSPLLSDDMQAATAYSAFNSGGSENSDRNLRALRIAAPPPRPKRLLRVKRKWRTGKTWWRAACRIWWRHRGGLGRALLGAVIQGVRRLTGDRSGG